MAETIREQIITAYVNHLGTMLISNGFIHNCGASVFRAQKNIDEDFLPAVVLRPKPETAQRSYGENEITTKLRIEAMVGFDPTAENSEETASKIQNELLGDIIRCMTGTETTVTELIDDISYSEGGPAEMPGEEDTIVGAYAEFEVRYRTAIGDPYKVSS